MSGFNLANYEPVEDRLARFWADHPAGRVRTELLHRDGDDVTFLAEIWRDATDNDPAATGHAAETRTQRGVNSTSHVENCETSAIGRALANLGYAPKGARPSREEMTKAASRDEQPPPDLGGFATITERKQRIAELRAAVDAADAASWVKDQQFPWPWTRDVCDAIEQHLAEPF